MVQTYSDIVMIPNLLKRKCHFDAILATGWAESCQMTTFGATRDENSIKLTILPVCNLLNDPDSDDPLRHGHMPSQVSSSARVLALPWYPVTLVVPAGTHPGQHPGC